MFLFSRANFHIFLDVLLGNSYCNSLYEEESKLPTKIVIIWHSANEKFLNEKSIWMPQSPTCLSLLSQAKTKAILTDPSWCSCLWQLWLKRTHTFKSPLLPAPILASFLNSVVLSFKGLIQFLLTKRSHNNSIWSFQLLGIILSWFASFISNAFPPSKIAIFFIVVEVNWLQ